MPGRYPEGPWPIDSIFHLLILSSWKWNLLNVSLEILIFHWERHYLYNIEIESKLNAHVTNCLLQAINSKPLFSDSFQLPAIKVLFIFRIPCPCKFARTEHREICFCMVSAFHKMSLFCVLLCLAGEHVYSPDVKQTNRKRSYSHNRGTGKFRTVEVEENLSPKWSWRPLHPWLLEKEYVLCCIVWNILVKWVI